MYNRNHDIKITDCDREFYPYSPLLLSKGKYMKIIRHLKIILLENIWKRLQQLMATLTIHQRMSYFIQITFQWYKAGLTKELLIRHNIILRPAVLKVSVYMSTTQMRQYSLSKQRPPLCMSPFLIHDFLDSVWVSLLHSYCSHHSSQLLLTASKTIPWTHKVTGGQSDSLIVDNTTLKQASLRANWKEWLLFMFTCN